MTLLDMNKPLETLRVPRKPYTAEDEEAYPSSDGEPMAETVEHRLAMTYAIDAVVALLRHREDVWVNGNDFFYYVEGDRNARVSPDCYAVIGVPGYSRRRYLLWEEGKAPNIVLEFTSKGTSKVDRVEKYNLYERIGVNEYILFDPLNEYLRPRLQGYRLVNGSYQRIPLESNGHLFTEELGTTMFADGILLRFINPETGSMYLNRQEIDARVDEEILRADYQAHRAEQEARRAEQEARRAEQEAAARREADGEIARLRAELAALKGNSPAV